MTAPSVLTRRAALAAVLLAVAGPALANSPKKKEGKEGKEGEEAAPDPIVKLQSIAIPIIVDGKLINYIFVNMSLKMAKDVPVTAMAGMEPFLRDAVVRAAHRTPFVKSDTYNEIDAHKLEAVVMSECATLVGKGKVASMEITKQIARNQLPRPSAAKPASSAQAAPRPPTSSADIIP